MNYMIFSSHSLLLLSERIIALVNYALIQKLEQKKMHNDKYI